MASRQSPTKVAWKSRQSPEISRYGSIPGKGLVMAGILVERPILAARVSYPPAQRRATSGPGNPSASGGAGPLLIPVPEGRRQVPDALVPGRHEEDDGVPRRLVTAPRISRGPFF